jgi:hypothetical protein
MWHVTAQLSVAVTSRAMLFALDAFDVEHTFAYLLSLWLPVVGSALVVELALGRAPLRLSLSVSRESLASASIAHDGQLARASLVPVLERA